MEIFNNCPLDTRYKVGDQGTVQGIRRDNIGSIKADGYCIAHIKGIGQRYIHRLVYEAFKGEIPKGLEINHINGIKNDNRLINLELVTHSQNIQHSYTNLNRQQPKGKLSANYGRKATKEAKKLMSVKKIGSKHPKFKGYYIINGVQYESTYIAEQQTGINKVTILRRCKANKQGYSFKPI